MFRSRYNRGEQVRGLRFCAPSLVQSQYQAGTDINVMLQRSLRGDPDAIRRGRSYDASNCPDSFHDAMNILAGARTRWEEMPSALQRAYGSPERYLAAVDAQIRAKSLASSNNGQFVTTKSTKSVDSQGASPTVSE